MSTRGSFQPKATVPKPFQRPSIDLSPTTAAPRSWANIEAQHIVQGDIVANCGYVHHTGVTTSGDVWFVAGESPGRFHATREQVFFTFSTHPQ